MLAERSERDWGKRQTRAYLGALEVSIQKIVTNPMLGQEAGLKPDDVRRIRSGREVIFYRFDDNEVEIVRILHDRMDHEGRLK